MKKLSDQYCLLVDKQGCFLNYGRHLHKIGIHYCDSTGDDVSPVAEIVLTTVTVKLAVGCFVFPELSDAPSASALL